MANTVTIKTGGIKHFDRVLRRGDGPVRTIVKQFGVEYLGDMKRKYVKKSQSPGNPWPDLKPSTKRSRRKARRGSRRRSRGGKRKFAILRDNGLLLNALDVGAQGNEFDQGKHEVTVGFSGNARHPEGKATFRDIAEFHQNGAGNLPQREILEVPDRKLTRKFERITQMQIRKLGEQSERRT